jgi:hypothetical protein
LTQAGSVTGQAAEVLLETGVDEGVLELVGFTVEQALKTMLITRKKMKRRGGKFIEIFSFAMNTPLIRTTFQRHSKHRVRNLLLILERAISHPLHDSRMN